MSRVSRVDRPSSAFMRMLKGLLLCRKQVNETLHNSAVPNLAKKRGLAITLSDHVSLAKTPCQILPKMD